MLKTSKKHPLILTHRPAVGGLRAAVRAVGLARLDPAEVAAFRRKPSPIPEGWKPIAPTFLKASDEQSVAAVAAVLAAVARVEAGPSAFAEWGVVAASCHLGRSQLVVALKKFAQEGVWGVSPHLIPHYALHSPAGTLSLALGAHGPNLGVGGGPGSVTEGALTALTWLSEGRLPGVWLVLTGHDPAFVPGPSGEPTTPSVCQALALALEPAAGSTRRPILRAVAPDGSEPSGPPDFLDLHARLASMIEDDDDFFGPDPGGPSTFAVDEGTGLRLEWSLDVARGGPVMAIDRDGPVWITGVGLATPLGHDVATLEANLLSGRPGVTAVTRFPTTDYSCRIAAQVEAVPRPAGLEPSVFDAMPRVDRVTAACVESALRDAGWWGRHRGARIGLVAGVGAEWMEVWEEDRIAGGDRILRPDRDGDTTVRRIGRLYGLSGPMTTLSAACASSNFAIEIARRWLRLGLVDVCLAGGAEMAVTPIGLATFGNLRALTRRNDDPAGASRPFDKGRDGFVLGEGGVLFVLERAEDARDRSAQAYAEVAGCGSSSDAHHHVIPSPDPSFAAAAIRQALADARVNPDEVDHINAHATSTPVGDACEASALRLVFGDGAAIPVTSTKSMTGHLLTAAGAIEAVACIAAMKHGAIPPTINLDEPDVDLCLVANEAREHKVRVAVSNSFGFGGSNTCLVLRAV